MDYAAHIARICKIEDIECQLVSWGHGRSWHKNRRIRIKPAKTGITYAIALHELGHILDPKGHRGTRLDKETAAWNWAKANAKEWTGAMENKMQKCLQSYLKRSERHKTMKQADASHPIHAMAGLAQ